MFPALVPPTPRIDRLIPDYISDTFQLEWSDGGSAFPYDMDATWEIQILYKDPMEEVDLVSCLSSAVCSVSLRLNP